MTPRISVVIPTCNRPVLLARCLEALAPGRQTGMRLFDQPGGEPSYEVIVSDDGTSAETRAMISDRFPWVRWFEGPRRGPAANRNHGARQASADWLAFTDDDAEPESDWLGALVHAIRPGLPVLEGRTLSRDMNRAYSVAPINDKGGCLWSCNLGIEKTFFLRIGGFDAGFPFAHLEDVDLRLRIQDAGERFEFVPEAVVQHPARPLGGVIAQARAHESYFYLAAKRRVPLAAVGLSFPNFLRARWQTLRRSRSLPEAVRFCLRCAVESVAIAWLLPSWITKYRKPN